jgi:AcrR family transcriptional regulator
MASRLVQLPSGRHGLSRGFVARNQRERILEATITVVAEYGYATATVGDIVTTARLSRRTFYEHFANKEECFLAAYDATVKELMTEVAGGWTTASDWRTKIRSSVEAFVGYIVAHPVAARACIVEVAGAGEAARRRRDEAIQAFADFLGAAARALSTQRDVSPVAVELIVGGLYEFVYSRLVRDRPEDLAAALPELVFHALVPFGGHREAAEQAGRVQPST